MAVRPADFAEYRKMLDALDQDGNAGVREAAGRFRQTLPGAEKIMAQRLAEEEDRKRKADEARPKSTPPPTVRFNATRAELDKEIDERQQKTGSFRRIPLTVFSGR